MHGKRINVERITKREEIGNANNSIVKLNEATQKLKMQKKDRQNLK